ncbi:hypothetical protein WDU94_008263 [Cyamophila willieti]
MTSDVLEGGYLECVIKEFKHRLFGLQLLQELGHGFLQQGSQDGRGQVVHGILGHRHGLGQELQQDLTQQGLGRGHVEQGPQGHGLGHEGGQQRSGGGQGNPHGRGILPQGGGHKPQLQLQLGPQDPREHILLVADQRRKLLGVECSLS